MSNRQRLELWSSLVEKRELRVGIIGLGYVGLPLVLLFSEEGFRVTGFDIDVSKVNLLNAESHIYAALNRHKSKTPKPTGFVQRPTSPRSPGSTRS